MATSGEQIVISAPLWMIGTGLTFQPPWPEHRKLTVNEIPLCHCFVALQSVASPNEYRTLAVTSFVYLYSFQHEPLE